MLSSKYSGFIGKYLLVVALGLMSVSSTAKGSSAYGRRSTMVSTQTKPDGSVDYRQGGEIAYVSPSVYAYFPFGLLTVENEAALKKAIASGDVRTIQQMINALQHRVLVNIEQHSNALRIKSEKLDCGSAEEELRRICNHYNLDINAINNAYWKNRSRSPFGDPQPAPQYEPTPLVIERTPVQAPTPLTVEELTKKIKLALGLSHPGLSAQISSLMTAGDPLKLNLFLQETINNINTLSRAGIQLSYDDRQTNAQLQQERGEWFLYDYIQFLSTRNIPEYYSHNIIKAFLESGFINIDKIGQFMNPFMCIYLYTPQALKMSLAKCLTDAGAREEPAAKAFREEFVKRQADAEQEREDLAAAETAEAARVAQVEAMRLGLEKEDSDRAQKEDSDRAQNVAATRIQKIARGKQARRNAQTLRAAKKEASRTVAATKIQKIARKYNAQKQYKKMQNAARKIQKARRGYVGRKRETALVSPTAAASSSDSDMPPVATFAGSSVVPTLSMPGRSMMAAGGGYATELGGTGEVDTSGDADRLARIEAVRLHRHDAAGAGLAPRLQIIVDNLRKATFNKMMVNRRLLADGVTDPAEKTAVFNALGIKE